MALTAFLDGIVGLIRRYHDFVEVDFVVQVVVELQAFEGFQHLVNFVLELLD